MYRLLFTVQLILTVTLSLNAAPQEINVDTALDCNCHIYKAYINQDIDDWGQLITKTKKRYEKTGHKNCLFNLISAIYGYTGFLSGYGTKDEIRKYIEMGDQYIAIMKKNGYYPSRAKALEGAFTAFKIGISPSKTITLGPKSIKLINKAIEIDPTCPYGWVEKANSEYHMPRIFGGSYENAIEYYSRAIRIFESRPEWIECNWYYLNAILWLAKSYDQINKKEKTLQSLRKIKKQAPAFETINEWIDNYQENGRLP